MLRGYNLGQAILSPARDPMTRKPLFWIILGLLSLGGGVLAVRLFPVAFPLLSVDIQMDRQEALSEGMDLADEFGWEPANPRQAASFSHLNPAFQTYMELEGGGLEKLNRLVREGSLTLYAWRVRHFSAGVVEEVEVRFTPEGDPLGFGLVLSEDAPGENLPAEEARELAVAEAVARWGMDLSLHELLESSQEEQPGGRIDHSFVYQRTDLGLGEASLRLRLRVAGNRVAGVSPFFHVPESFLRRFQDTRDANNSVFLIGTIAFLVLFLFLAGGGGMVHLLRRRLLEWKAPLAWGLLISGLMALGTVNSLPLAWMEYDTALPPQIFVGTIVLLAVFSFLAGTIFLASLFMAGEGLLRVGFPAQIRLWKFWTPGVANSTPVIGRTLAPYLVLGLELGFVVTFYLLTARIAGWWSPASSLVEPDLLASYLPWLTAVSTSLFAAFSEETIFRAIPIGAAAILGRKYGRARLWIWGAIVLQAIVFGASHANYPQQPAYARVVEIFPVYLGWGAVCAYFGLVPAILGHYTYDLVLFSLPLFTAETPGIWLDRTIVVVAGTLPLLIVGAARWRNGAARQAPDWSLNRNWSQPTRPEEAEAGDRAPPESEGMAPDDQDTTESEAPATVTVRLPKAVKAGILVAGLAGLALGVTTGRNEVPPIFTTGLAQAERMARSALEQEGVNLGPEWEALPSIAASRGLSHQFVWHEGSPEAYETLLGRFLNGPRWSIRFVRFHATPEERAETYSVTLGPTGTVLGIIHRLPEDRPGESLAEEVARTIAVEAVQNELGLDPGDLREVSAEEAVRPNRTDWTFTFSAPEDYPLATGEGRAEIRLAGAEVASARRFVHVPEEWEREWRADESRRQLALLPLAALLLSLAFAAGILAIFRWARGTLRVGPARVLTGTLLVILLLSALNEWPGTAGTFTADESYTNQLGVTLVSLIFGLALMAAMVGTLGGLAHTWVDQKLKRLKGADWIGLAIGMAYSGSLSALAPRFAWGPPGWPDYGGALASVPSASLMLGALSSSMVAIVGVLLIVAALDRAREGGRVWLILPVLLLLGLTGASNPPGRSWWIWFGGALGIALAVALLWLLCRRMGWAIVPGAVAASIVLESLHNLTLQPHLGWSAGGVLAIVAVLLLVRFWTAALQAKEGPAPT